jgi:hypothetical protein
MLPAHCSLALLFRAQVIYQKVRAWTLFDLFETECVFFGSGGIPNFGDEQKPPVELPFFTKRANTSSRHPDK